jgi:hypothetical protein
MTSPPPVHHTTHGWRGTELGPVPACLSPVSSAERTCWPWGPTVASAASQPCPLGERRLRHRTAQTGDQGDPQIRQRGIHTSFGGPLPPSAPPTPSSLSPFRIQKGKPRVRGAKRPVGLGFESPRFPSLDKDTGHSREEWRFMVPCGQDGAASGMAVSSHPTPGMAPTAPPPPTQSTPRIPRGQEGG